MEKQLLQFKMKYVGDVGEKLFSNVYANKMIRVEYSSQAHTFQGELFNITSKIGEDLIKRIHW